MARKLYGAEDFYVGYQQPTVNVQPGKPCENLEEASPENYVVEQPASGWKGKIARAYTAWASKMGERAVKNNWM